MTMLEVGRRRVPQLVVEHMTYRFELVVKVIQLLPVLRDFTVVTLREQQITESKREQHTAVSSAKITIGREDEVFDVGHQQLQQVSEVVEERRTARERAAGCTDNTGRSWRECSTRQSHHTDEPIRCRHNFNVHGRAQCKQKRMTSREPPRAQHKHQRVRPIENRTCEAPRGSCTLLISTNDRCYIPCNMDERWCLGHQCDDLFSSKVCDNRSEVFFCSSASYRGDKKRRHLTRSDEKGVSQARHFFHLHCKYQDA